MPLAHAAVRVGCCSGAGRASAAGGRIVVFGLPRRHRGPAAAASRLRAPPSTASGARGAGGPSALLVDARERRGGARVEPTCEGSGPRPSAPSPARRAREHALHSSWLGAPVQARGACSAKAAMVGGVPAGAVPLRVRAHRARSEARPRPRRAELLCVDSHPCTCYCAVSAPRRGVAVQVRVPARLLACGWVGARVHARGSTHD
jgi:hypothetical protein